jgi:pilus assembly protein CpaD
MAHIDSSREFRLRNFAFGLAVLAALSSGGCAFTARDETTSSVPADYRLRHPIGIKEGERSLDLLIGKRRGGLTAMQRTEVINFAQLWRQNSTGGIIIDVPAGTSNAKAATDALGEVRAVLASAGVPPGAVQTRGYRPADPLALATLRLNYPQMKAETGSCGLWPADLGATLDPEWNKNQPYWNLGCASQRNLAAMVDNPADLVQPRSETPIYSQRRATVFERYRGGKATPAEVLQTDRPRISDVGQ